MFRVDEESKLKFPAEARLTTLQEIFLKPFDFENSEVTLKII